jgi:hypothetical protein
VKHQTGEDGPVRVVQIPLSPERQSVRLSVRHGQST